MSRLRRYVGVDSAAQTLGATETVTMSLATNKVDCTKLWYLTPQGEYPKVSRRHRARSGYWGFMPAGVRWVNRIRQNPGAEPLREQARCVMNHEIKKPRSCGVEVMRTAGYFF